MSSTRQNRHIARLIVGAMSIDGSLDQKESEKVAQTLQKIGMGELIADVGAAIDDYDDSFNMYEECKKLVETLGTEAKQLAPVIFRMVVDVVASDRFVSANEATYLSAMARRLGLTAETAQQIFKEVMTERRGRLEIAASSVDEILNPHLKQLLSFKGAEDLVGQAGENSIHEMMHKASEGEEGIKISVEDLERALTVLGLKSNATLENAEEVWRETIENLDLPKMLDSGETFVSAAIARIGKINDAYRTILQFHQHTKKAKIDT